MIFGQLSNRDSSRDLVVAVQARQSKSYYLGLGKGVYLSTIVVANSNRSYRIYEDFAILRIEIARKKMRLTTLR